MAETKNIFIPRTVAAENTDSLVKTGTASIELRNGDIVAVGDKTNGIFELTAVTSTTTRYGVVYNADVVTESGYRGLSDDPRNVTFAANTPVNFYIPKKNDEIAVTVVAGTSANATHLVPTVNGTGYTYASEAGSTLSFAITGNKFISVGNERVATVEAICVAE